MISLNPVSHSRSISLTADNPNPDRLTLLFNVMMVSCVVVAIGVYLYQWLHRSFEDLGNQALEGKEFQKAADCFTRSLNSTAPPGENERRFQRLIQGCKKALSSADLAVQSRAQFLIVKGEANLGLNKPAEALQDFKAVLELDPATLKPEDFSRLIQGCDKALLSPNLEVQSRAGVRVLKGQAYQGLNKPSEAFRAFKTALALLYLNLKSGAFSQVIESCDSALKSDNLPHRLRVQFLMQKGLAYLSLSNPSEARHCFARVIELDVRELNLGAQAYYFLGLVSKETGDAFYAAECCDKALDELTHQDIELKTQILTFKALSLMEIKDFSEAIETANLALRLSTDKTPKEILVILYFCLANSNCAQKKYIDGFSYFAQALANNENDSFLRAYILSFRGYYHRLAAKSSAPEAQKQNLRQADKDFQEASQCKSYGPWARSVLLRCMMWPLFEKLMPEESPVTRLAKKIEKERKANSVSEPQE
jgi:tetratricopeptide (TPR) repeat protein